jgi:hypothetical protein
VDDYALVNEILGLVPPGLRDLPGGPLYSGRDAWRGTKQMYLMGINPGGSPESGPTVAEQAASILRAAPTYSVYLHEEWMTATGKLRAAGTAPLQKRVLHLFRQLDLEPGTVPASNMVFVRSRREHHIEAGQMRSWADVCWPFHAAMIERLGVRVVVCMGKNVAGFVRAKVGSHTEVDSFSEGYGSTRPRVSRTFTGGSVIVVQAAHPTFANWCNPLADISPLVQSALALR